MEESIRFALRPAGGGSCAAPACDCIIEADSGSECSKFRYVTMSEQMGKISERIKRARKIMKIGTCLGQTISAPCKYNSCEERVSDSENKNLTQTWTFLRTKVVCLEQSLTTNSTIVREQSHLLMRHPAAENARPQF